MRTALPLAFLTSLICLLDPRLGWLALIATVIWATLRHQRQIAGPVSAGMGARMGALMGLMTFVFSLVLGALGFALSMSLQHNGSEVRAEMIKQMQQVAARNPDPMAQEFMRWFMTDSGMMFFLGFGLFVFFIIFLASATATGAVTGAIASRKPHH